MGQLATGLLSLSGWAALALLFMLPALEAPAFRSTAGLSMTRGLA